MSKSNYEFQNKDERSLPWKEKLFIKWSFRQQIFFFFDLSCQTDAKCDSFVDFFEEFSEKFG